MVLVVVAAAVVAAAVAAAVVALVDIAAVVVAAVVFGCASDFPKSPKDNFRLSFVPRGLKAFDARRASDDKLALDVLFLPLVDLPLLFFLLALPLLLLLVLLLLADSRRPAAPVDECRDEEALAPSVVPVDVNEVSITCDSASRSSSSSSSSTPSSSSRLRFSQVVSGIVELLTRPNSSDIGLDSMSGKLMV